MKKVKMKINILIAFLFIFAACDVLDVDPMHSIPADQAITNKNDVERAITGCYDAFQSAGYYGRNYMVVGDLAADVLKWTGTTAGYNQIDNNSILADNVIVEGIWSSIYNALNRINNVIAQVPDVEELTEEETEAYLAELYFLRALSHHNLTKVFGPVPVRTEPVSSSDEDLNVPRKPVSIVYEQIFSDLEFAEQHIRTNIVRGKASKAAVLALKARASLDYYFISEQTSWLNDAIDAASDVIDDFGLLVEPDFSVLFDGTPNKEAIFEIEYNEQDRNRLAEYFFPTSLSGRHEFSPTEILIEAFDENDIRFDYSIAVDGNETYSLKYSDIEQGTDNVYVFRLAEMHLIRAEAYAVQDIEPAKVQSDLNVIRLRAGIGSVTTSNFENLRNDIAAQRMKEFAFEGHRWFDLVRTGKAIDVLDNVTNINQTLFPIPLNEILTNSHEDMYQNDGY